MIKPVSFAQLLFLLTLLLFLMAMCSVPVRLALSHTLTTLSKQLFHYPNERSTMENCCHCSKPSPEVKLWGQVCHSCEDTLDWGDDED
jgi:hypothetical protein